MNALPGTWEEANQAALMRALEPVYRALGRAAGIGDSEPSPAAQPCHPLKGEEVEGSTLAQLCAVFELTPFERDLLLLCAGVELASRVAAACAAAQGDPRRIQPTFSLALSILPEAHWSALSRDRPLRYWRLIEVLPGDSLVTSPLRIDERILQFLTGVVCLDERLEGVLRRLAPHDEVPEFLRPVAVLAAQALSSPGPTREPIRVALVGRSASERRLVADTACRIADRPAHLLWTPDLPAGVADRELLARLWNRESRLTGNVLCVQFAESDGAELSRQILPFLDRLEGPLILELSEETRLDDFRVIRLTIPDLPNAERRKLLVRSLGPEAAKMNGRLEAIVDQFRLDPGALESVGATAQRLSMQEPAIDLPREVWRLCRSHARRSLEQLTTRTEPRGQWRNLVLPPLQTEMLRQIAAQVRQRARVHDAWGFANHYSQGLGITALFAGASGTGKTMAAEVVAATLDLDLYQIDLATVVSKYIGETEKNLRRIFDAATDSGAVLLFDEADALFGKRTEVKDSHDRYANLEVSYLLQRMESYRGLAILTTNMKHAIDAAFLRRLRFIVDFPFPDAAYRTRIWQTVFPPETPTDGLDYPKLGRLNVPGGIIRNIALHAAYLAADEDSPVLMEHLLRAARVEYAKLDRPLTSAETGGWL
jgi:hypothetical protein